MDIADFLSRLSRVHQSGRDRWMARCPAHADRGPSLSIRLAQDGRILLHCFAGCGASDVVEAMGLTLSDLFARPLYHRAKPVSRVLSPSEALRALAHEAGVVAIAAADIAEGKALSAQDASRVCLAAGRLAAALEVIYGG